MKPPEATGRSPPQGPQSQGLGSAALLPRLHAGAGLWADLRAAHALRRRAVHAGGPAKKERGGSPAWVDSTSPGWKVL